MNKVKWISRNLFSLLLINLFFSSCVAKKTSVDQTQTEEKIEAPQIVEVPDDIIEEELVLKEFPPPPPPPPYRPSDDWGIVEQMPRFPGCEDLMTNEQEKKECAQEKLIEFVYSNLNYPAIAKENEVEGTCVVTFAVEKDGHLNAIRLVRDIGASCGQEAIRIVQSMNDQGIVWIPGNQNGRPVRVQFNLPVKFKLPEDD